jgi:hypothetical protein
MSPGLLLLVLLAPLAAAAAWVSRELSCSSSAEMLSVAAVLRLNSVSVFFLADSRDLQGTAAGHNRMRDISSDQSALQNTA